MDKSWKIKKNTIFELIKKISDKNGGDDPVWLKDYCQEVIKLNALDLDKVLLCFEELLKNEEIKPLRRPHMHFKTIVRP